MALHGSTFDHARDRGALLQEDRIIMDVVAIELDDLLSRLIRGALGYLRRSADRILTWRERLDKG